VETIICAVCLNLGWSATRRADVCLHGCHRLQIASSKLPLSILRTEYETPPVRRLGQKWAMWAIAGKQSRLTSDVATSAVPDVGGRMKSGA
jgi:hypothetical protein